jgi:hypothetical protein
MCILGMDPGFRATISEGQLRNPLLLFLLAVVGGMATVWILQSNGFYPVDECAHFLYSRFVLKALPVTVQTWHRPGRLWLFALPAQLGHTFTMFFALALFLSLLLITYQTAVLMKIKHAEWVVMLAGLQPVFFDISYACLAEVPAAFLIVLSYWFHLRGKSGWSLAIASMVFLFRFEMYLFALLMFFVYLKSGRRKILPLVLLGPLLWIGSSAIISGDVMTFFREWSRFSKLGKYVPGAPLGYYLENLHNVYGYAQVTLFVAGVTYIVRAKRGADFAILFCIIGINIIVNTFAGAELFHWTGSIGEFRYIAVVAPLVAIVAVFGLSEILDRAKPAWARRVPSLAVFGVVIVNCIFTTHPRQWAPYDQIVIAMTERVRSRYPDLTLLSNNYVVPYVMDVAPTGGSHFSKLDRDTLAAHPECVIAWDSFSSNPRFDQTEWTMERLLQDSTMVLLKRQRYGDAEYLLLYRNVEMLGAQRREVGDSFRGTCP